MTTTTSNGTALSASTRPSSTTDLQVGKVTLKLGQHARLTVEVRAPTKAAAMAKAAALAERFLSPSGGGGVLSALVPPQVKQGLRLARAVAVASGTTGGLRKLWRRLPRSLRSRASGLARELTS